MANLNTKSLAKTKRNLSKIVAEAKKTGEPTFILHENKPEAVLLSIEAYEILVKQFEDSEGKNFETEAAKKIAIYGTQKTPETYRSDYIGVDFPDVEWSEDDGWG